MGYIDGFLINSNHFTEGCSQSSLSMTPKSESGESKMYPSSSFHSPLIHLFIHHKTK